jgi:hypothetical protein
VKWLPRLIPVCVALFFIFYVLGARARETGTAIPIWPFAVLFVIKSCGIAAATPPGTN